MKKNDIMENVTCWTGWYSDSTNVFLYSPSRRSARNVGYTGKPWSRKKFVRLSYIIRKSQSKMSRWKCHRAREMQKKLLTAALINDADPASYCSLLHIIVYARRCETSKDLLMWRLSHSRDWSYDIYDYRKCY